MSRARNEELRRGRISEGLKRAYAEGRRVPVCATKGKHLSEATREKISRAQKGIPKPAWLREKYSLAKIGKDFPYLHNPEVRAKAAMALKASGKMKQRWQEPQFRDKLLAHLKELNGSPEQKNNSSKGGKAVWQLHGDRLIEHLRELREKRGIEYYREIGRKGIRACHAYPNKQESELLNILNTKFLGQWEYVGDGSKPIANLYPDFINTNGRKLVIEFFGDYWHDHDDEEIKRRIYDKYGYSLLVIWSNELKDKDKVIAKIEEFTNARKT